jgi:hypothetical protein
MHAMEHVAGNKPHAGLTKVPEITLMTENGKYVGVLSFDTFSQP